MPISVKLPLRRDLAYGLSMNDTHLDAIKQNLKHLILTSPGERPMLANFGVGLRRYLFQPNHELVDSEISSKIYEQVALWMPFLRIEEVQIQREENLRYIRVTYFVKPMSMGDTLEVKISEDSVIS